MIKQAGMVAAFAVTLTLGAVGGASADTYTVRGCAAGWEAHADQGAAATDACAAGGGLTAQQLAVGQPGREGAGMKLAFARLNQEISGLEVELRGAEGLLYDDWTMRRPELVDFTGRDAGYRYLRAKGNSIEGGTSEILLNIVAERVLGLPGEPRTDKDVAWKDLAR